MIEKVNPDHPDKIADRIAGAIIDLAYKKQKNPTHGHPHNRRWHGGLLCSAHPP